MVVAWANDVPFRNWFQLLKETHNWDDLDTAPDYEVILMNGKPYLFDPLKGCRRPSLDMTTYMFTSLNAPSPMEPEPEPRHDLPPET